MSAIAAIFGLGLQTASAFSTKVGHVSGASKQRLQHVPASLHKTLTRSCFGEEASRINFENYAVSIKSALQSKMTWKNYAVSLKSALDFRENSSDEYDLFHEFYDLEGSMFGKCGQEKSD